MGRDGGTPDRDAALLRVGLCDLLPTLRRTRLAIVLDLPGFDGGRAGDDLVPEPSVEHDVTVRCDALSDPAMGCGDGGRGE